MPDDQRTAAIYVIGSGRSRDDSPNLKQWAEATGAPVVWFRERLDDPKRAAWSQLWGKVQGGKIRTIVVDRLSALRMSYADLQAFFDDLDSHGVDLVSLGDGIRGLDALDRGSMLALIKGFAESDRAYRSLRQRTAITSARARGSRLGRPVGTGRRVSVTDEKASHIVDRIARGMGVTAIGREIGVSRPTVYRVVKEETGKDVAAWHAERAAERAAERTKRAIKTSESSN